MVYRTLWFKPINVEVLYLRRVKKPVFFIVAISILLFTVIVFTGVSTQYGDIKKTYINGVDDIRWGIDIRGGVDVTFTPPEGIDATDDQMNAAKEKIKLRLVNLSITDSDVFVDYNNDRIIVRFPWQAGDEDFDPEAAVMELGETALLTFREGVELDELGKPTGITNENIILQGADVVKAEPVVQKQSNGSYEYMVSLKLSNEGAESFSKATGELYKDKGVISIWMDDTLLSYPTVSEQIKDGEAVISGSFTAEECKELADKITAGALPFKLITSSFSTMTPTLGLGARDAMVLAGLIAFIAVAIFMVVVYRLPGTVAIIALIGQVAGSIAAITGFFGFMSSFTLTIPGIAGVILSIGMGVDANVITNERIKEELRAGKTLDGAINAGYEQGFTAIFDGNITVILVAVILMGAFGTPDSIFAKLLNPIFFMFGPSTEGSIYSFGFTLLVGVILNFIMGVLASRLMVSSISKFKGLRNPWLYGGASNETK